MTPTVKENILIWQEACKAEMNSSRFPLVDTRAAQHQFFGYLATLEQMEFITDAELMAALEQGLAVLSGEQHKMDVVKNTCNMDKGREYLAKNDHKQIGLNWDVTCEELAAAMYEIRHC